MEHLEGEKLRITNQLLVQVYHLDHNDHSLAPIYAYSVSSMSWFTMHYLKILQAFNILEDDMQCGIVKIGNIIFDW